jgi:hypothetical protein
MNKTATLSMPFDPDSTIFPTRKELPTIPGAPEGAAWVWGDNDNIGRLNLLTPTRVAAGKEIRSGEIVPVNLPLNTPEVPAFNREVFKHEIKVLAEDVAYDDVYHLNTQSGTQFDGFRHFAHIPSGTFYNNTKGSDIVGPNANHKCSIHHWAVHGIAVVFSSITAVMPTRKASTMIPTNTIPSPSKNSSTVPQTRVSTSVRLLKVVTSKSVISFSSGPAGWRLITANRQPNGMNWLLDHTPWARTMVKGLLD